MTSAPCRDFYFYFIFLFSFVFNLFGSAIGFVDIVLFSFGLINE